jgi:hypothetical protein
VIKSLWVAVVLIACGPAAASAREIAIGVFSFDVLIPGGSASPGVNAFALSNLTGGFSLPPEFPVATVLGLLNAEVALPGGISHPLGSIGPGVHLPDVLQFADTELFSFATFSAVLAETDLLLTDGTTFMAASPRVSARLLPSGPDLVPGSEAAVILISDIPEPGTYWFALVGLATAAIRRRITKRKR